MDTILGVGIDILDLRRLSPGSLNADDPFLDRVFTAREIAQAARSGDPTGEYALRFSAKEAVYKAVKTSPDRVKGTDAEILRDPSGLPFCTLHGSLAARAAEKGGRRMHISFSRDGDTVAALAVLESE